jgi:hypothetical protein
MIVRGKGTVPTSFLIRYELLLLSLSSYILRFSLPKEFPESRRLVLGTGNVDSESVRVHVLMHTYQLSRDVRRRKQIYQETQSFAALLREKEQLLNEKERNRKKNLDFKGIVQQCSTEQSRWDRNWTTIKGEWILDSIKQSLSPTPPTNFFSQSYHTAFINHIPSPKRETPTIIQSSNTTSETNIANLVSLEKSLTEEIALLEKELGPFTPTRKSSIRNSLPPTPTKTPSPSPSRTNAYNLRFSRSASRLSRSSSESPRSRMTAEHCMPSCN